MRNCPTRCALVEPDPDIAGVGVILAFFSSAAMTVFCALVADGMSGGFDIWPLHKMTASRKRFWARVLDRFILGLSDQQLVTGYSILMVGFVKVMQLSTYHFFLVVSLAMFSCSAHLASVLSLRRYFQDRPKMAKIRFFVMITFALALIVALLMAGAPLPGLSVDLRCPAICFIWHFWKNGHFIRKMVGIGIVLLLVFSYWAALSYMLPPIFLTKWLLTKPLELAERTLRIYQLHERFMHWRPHIPGIVVSQGAQLVWWVISLLFSILLRFRGSKPVRGSESVWGFGQLLAVFLITLPFMSAAEIYYEEQMQDSSTDDAPQAAALATSPSVTERCNVDCDSSSFVQPQRVDTEQRIGGLDNAISSALQRNNAGDGSRNQPGPIRNTAIPVVEGSAVIERRPTADLTNI